MPNAYQSKSVAAKAGSQRHGSASKAQMLRAITYWSLRKTGKGHGSAVYKGQTKKKGSKNATLTKQKTWLKKNNAKQLRKRSKERNAKYGTTVSQRRETSASRTRSKKAINKANIVRQRQGLSKIKVL